MVCQNSINVNASGVVSYDSTTGVFSESALTQHDVLVAGSGNSIVSISPSTAGLVLTSNGTSADPSFQASSGGSITLTGDSGTASGSALTIFANTAADECGITVKFGNSGTTSTLHVSDSNNNTVIGQNSGFSMTVGFADSNTVLGQGSMVDNTNSSSNTVVGNASLTNLTGLPFAGSGGQNVVLGAQNLQSLINGSQNVAIGWNTANAYTGAENSNIIISNDGVVGDFSTIRIGRQGSTGLGLQSTCYIAGITGSTVTGAAVLCSTAGQLGTVPSSRRFKENIFPMETSSEVIYDLDPVTFTYKSNPEFGMQYGLIAEDVQDVMPSLVVLDQEGLPSAVKYHDLPVMLLNEIKKLKDRIKVLEGRRN